MSSVVGYSEDFKYDEDLFNKVPKYCSRCGRELDIIEKDAEFDIYTGKPIKFSYISCPTLNGLHDIWRKEKYGAWVNYAQKGV